MKISELGASMRNASSGNAFFALPTADRWIIYDNAKGPYNLGSDVSAFNLSGYPIPKLVS